jgi:hypothetical protein
MAQGTPTNPSRLTIRFAVNGFPCELAMDVNAADFGQRLDQAVQIITAAGGQPITSATPATPAQSAPASATPAPAGEAPRCKFHGPMKPSRFGGWYCPSKMGDGETYCDQKVAG